MDLPRPTLQRLSGDAVRLADRAHAARRAIDAADPAGAAVELDLLVDEASRLRAALGVGIGDRAAARAALFGDGIPPEVDRLVSGLLEER